MTATAIPEGFGPITPHLTVKGASDAIDFYKEAFGAEEVMRMPLPDNPSVLMHAEIRMLGVAVMLTDAVEEWGNKDPNALGGSAVAIHLYVNDCDAAYAKAIAAGCTSVKEPEDAFWGDRFASVKDPFGHQWSIATQTEALSPEEMMARAATAFD